MNLSTEFVKGTNLTYEFKTVEQTLNYEFVTPQPFNIEFKKGGEVNVAFARPHNTLEYEFSIGAQGPKGDQGTKGSIWFTGENSPSNNFGDSYDMYLNYITYDLYQKINGQWTSIGNIRGPQGPAGDGQGVLPAGGTIGQKLVKASATDFDTVWVDDINTTYIHNQGNTSFTWTINHNMAKYPSVTAVDTVTNPNGVEVIGDIEYIDSNNLTISFVNEIAGKAYLN